jgi:hypothetical protein
VNKDCYKPSPEERLARLEDENVETNNMLYELSIDIDMLKERLKTLENLIIGDGK